MTLARFLWYTSAAFPESSVESHIRREAHLGTTQHNVLRLNVGSLLKQDTGYSHDLDFSESRVDVAADLVLEELRGRIRLTRTPPGVYVAGELRARRNYDCSRCLTPLSGAAAVELSDLYSYPPSASAETEFSVTEDAELDLAPLLRELILLDEPARILCRADCAGLCPTCGANRNTEPCQCEEESVDPRLSSPGALRDLLGSESMDVTPQARL